MDSDLAQKYLGLLRKHPKLVPSELLDVKDLQRQIKHHIALTPLVKPKSSPINHSSGQELVEMKKARYKCVPTIGTRIC
jgi:hypothetical protein